MTLKSSCIELVCRLSTMILGCPDGVGAGTNVVSMYWTIAKCLGF